ncbi:WD domain, G-beta repeat [Plasmodiophora brassicae]|uniref:Uncharacterized protein n=1 Tax=Plasmodiophora brassicae TaxID=37360 RepID=A0A0G4J016_PLABS|nr:hypothetical protein PBRA_001728 [Plasmodiophora brassicae]SPQ93840.1 unnamed protein product [Plasmodiophora brassicae]
MPALLRAGEKRSYDELVEHQLEQELFGDVVADNVDRRNEEDATRLEKKPAWVDEDDECVRVDLSSTARNRKLRQVEDEVTVSGKEYVERLRTQFRKLHRTADWANNNGRASDEDDDEDAYLRSAQPLLARGAGGRLGTTSFRIARLKDANVNGVSESVVQSVAFHSNGQLLLTAGMDRTLRLFNVDGHQNNKLQSVHVADLPIQCASFVGSDEVWMSGPRKFFYTFDIERGAVEKVPGVRGRPDSSFHKFVSSPNGKHVAFLCQDGYVAIVSAKSKQCLGTVRVNGSVRSVAFSSDGSELTAFSADGDVYVFDVGSLKCRTRFSDHGCVKATRVAVAGNSKNIVATGSSTGVVNLYADGAPNPVKSIMSLTTAIDHLTFNHDGNLLIMASRQKQDALRIVHVPTRTVFPSWPTSQTPLHFVSAVAFAPDSRHLAIGNDRGRVLLYRLGCYE